MSTSLLATKMIEIEPITDGDVNLIERLRSGDESAFLTLIDRYHNPMIRLAQSYVRCAGIAEEVVQEAWMGVLHGIDRFEGRSGLKTWLFTILVNRAKTRGEKEGRSICFSDCFGGDSEMSQSKQAFSVSPERFRLASDCWPDQWVSNPNRWEIRPEDHALQQELQAKILREIEKLPQTQKLVITMRDIEGWTSEEVCGILEISQSNQRVLLHRARSRVRDALEIYFDPWGEWQQ